MTKTITFASGEDGVVGVTNDTNYVYAGLYTEPGKVVRINKDEFVIVGTFKFSDAKIISCQFID